ncbi:hypothetical protein JCM5350_004591 [Sporobolomyces pararoseus]
MAPAISLTDWYATLAYRDLTRRELCLKVVAETSGEEEDVEVRVVIRKTGKLFEGAWEKGLAEFRLIGTPSLDKAEAAGIPKEFFVTFDQGIPPNWTSILKETASRPPSFLATLPPHADPVPSTSKSLPIAPNTAIRQHQPLPSSFFDLGTGFTLKGRGGKISSTRELAQAIRDRKGKSRAIDQTEINTWASFKPRDEEYLREQRLKEKKDLEEKIAQWEKRVAEPEVDQGESVELNRDTEMHTPSESAVEESPPSPPRIIPSNETREPSAPPIPSTAAEHHLPLPITASTATSNQPLPACPPPVITPRTSSISNSLLDTSHRITIAALVSAFFQRGLPKLTQTEGPYVSFIRDIKEPVRQLLEALSVKIDLVSPSSSSASSSASLKPRRKLKKPSRPFELVVKPVVEEQVPSPTRSEAPRQPSADKPQSPKAPDPLPTGPGIVVDEDEEMSSAETEEEVPVPTENVQEEANQKVELEEKSTVVGEEDQAGEPTTQALSDAVHQEKQGEDEIRQSEPEEDRGLESEAAVAETQEIEMVDKSIEKEEISQEADESNEEKEENALVESGGEVINGEGEIEEEYTAAAAEEKMEVENEVREEEDRDEESGQQMVQITIKVDEREIKVEGGNEAEDRVQDRGEEAHDLDQISATHEQAVESEQREMSEDEEFEDGKVFVKLSPRVTGEYDELVPIKLDSSSPPPRLSSPPPPGSSPRPMAAELLAHPVNVLPSPPDSPPRSTPDPALPCTPSFSDLYEDYDSENSIDTEAQEVADFVERETMGHSSDGFEEVISPSKQRPSKTIEPPETVSEEPPQEAVEIPSTSNEGGVRDSTTGAPAPVSADQLFASNGTNHSQSPSSLSRPTMPDLSLERAEQPSPVLHQSSPPRLPSPFLESSFPENRNEVHPQIEPVIPAAGICSETRSSPTKLFPLESSTSLTDEISAAPHIEARAEDEAKVTQEPSDGPLGAAASSPKTIAVDQSNLSEALTVEVEAEQDDEQPSIPPLHSSPASNEPVPVETSEAHGQEAAERVMEAQSIESKAEEGISQAHEPVEDPENAVVDRMEEETPAERENPEDSEQSLDPKAASPLQNGLVGADLKTTKPVEDEEDITQTEVRESSVVETEKVEEVVAIEKENIVLSEQEMNGQQAARGKAAEEELPEAVLEERSNQIEEVEKDAQFTSASNELPDEVKGVLSGSSNGAEQVCSEEDEKQAEENLTEEVEIDLPTDLSPSPGPASLAVSSEQLPPVSRESDASIASQATEAAMKALRNESISSEPVGAEEDQNHLDQHDFGGGFDEEDGEQLPEFDPDGFETSIDTHYGQTRDREQTSTNATPLEESPQVETLPSPRVDEAARSRSRSRSPSDLPVDFYKDDSQRAERSPSLRLPEDENPSISTGSKHDLSEVNESRPRRRSLSTNSENEYSSSSEVRSPPPRRRPVGGWKPKQKKQSVEPEVVESDSDGEAGLSQVGDAEVEEEKIIETRPPRGKGKGKGKAPPSNDVTDAIDNEEDEDEISLSPRSKSLPSRKRLASPSTEEQQSSKPRKLPKTRKTEDAHAPDPSTSSYRKTKLRQRQPSADSGHGTATPEIQTESTTPSTSRKPRLSKPTPSRQSAKPAPVQPQATKLQNPSKGSASPQKTTKRPVQTKKSNGGGSKNPERGQEKAVRSAIKRRREVAEDGEESEEEVQEQVVVEKKKRGQPQAKKPKKVVAQSQAESEEEGEEDEITQPSRQRTTTNKKKKARSPSPVDGDYDQASASEQDDSSPAPATSKAKAKAPPKKRRKRKSIVMPRTKKRPSSTPQASSSKLKAKSKAVSEDVEEDEEKSPRAKAVRKPRKRESTAGSAKKGSSPSKKRKKFAESESEDSEEWKGD